MITIMNHAYRCHNKVSIPFSYEQVYKKIPCQYVSNRKQQTFTNVHEVTNLETGVLQ